MLNVVGWLAQSFSPLSARTHAALGRPMHGFVLPVGRIGELERPCTLEVPSKCKERQPIEAQAVDLRAGRAEPVSSTTL